MTSQSVVQEPQNDMYCSQVPSHYGEYYAADSSYYIPHDMAATHMCAVHGEYGEHYVLHLMVTVKTVET